MANTEIVIQTQAVNGKEIPVVTSRQIAQKFSMQHKNVLQAIKAQPDDEFSRLNFQPSDYANNRGKVYPEYLVTEQGFTLLAMGFTGAEARTWKIRFIEAFDALRVTAAESMQKQLDSQDRCRNLWNRIVSGSGSISYRNAETILGLEFGALGNLFCRHGICFRDPRTRKLHAYQGNCIAEDVTYNGDSGPYSAVRVTSIGLAWASTKIDQEAKALAAAPAPPPPASPVML